MDSPDRPFICNNTEMWFFIEYKMDMEAAYMFTFNCQTITISFGTVSKEPLCVFSTFPWKNFLDFKFSSSAQFKSMTLIGCIVVWLEIASRSAIGSTELDTISLFIWIISGPLNEWLGQTDSQNMMTESNFKYFEFEARTLFKNWIQ